MSHVDIPGTRHARLMAERTGREMFFATLGVSCLCLLAALMAVTGTAL